MEPDYTYTEDYNYKFNNFLWIEQIVVEFIDNLL